MAKKARRVPTPVDPASIKIHASGAPPKGMRRMGYVYAAILNGAANLNPGQWFEWPDAPKNWRASVKTWTKRGALPAGVEVYPDTSGRVIVARSGGTATPSGGPDAAGSIEQPEPAAPNAAPVKVPAERHQRLLLLALLPAGEQKDGTKLQRETGMSAGTFATAIRELKDAGLAVICDVGVSGKAWMLTASGIAAAQLIASKTK